VYVRGFLRTYADYLGLDAVPLLRQFATQSQRRSGARVGPPVFVRSRLRQRMRLLTNPRATVLLAGAVLGSAVLLYLAIEVGRFARAPSLDVSSPPGDRETSESTLLVRGTTNPAAEVRINGERTFVGTDGTFEETIGVSDGVNVLRIAATGIGGKERVVTREVLAHLPVPSAGPSPAPQSPAPATADANRSLRFSVQAEGESVWVSVSADGRVAFSGILLPGSRQEVSGREISVTSGKGARTRILIDGEDRGLLSTIPGVVRDIRFAPAALPALPVRAE
jgi:cytoskeletal protein RodZ